MAVRRRRRRRGEAQPRRDRGPGVGVGADPGARSTTAFKGAAQPDFVLLVTAKDGTVDDEAVRDAARRAAGAARPRARRRADAVVLEPRQRAALRSVDGRTGVVLAALAGEPDERIDHAAELSAALHDRHAGRFEVEVTGKSPIEEQISERAEKDLQRSELLTAPLVFIALVIVFGSLVAALLPLVVGVLAVLGTFVVLTLLAESPTVSVFALNLTTALGLGLAIDYSLFIVSRYREELAAAA